MSLILKAYEYSLDGYEGSAIIFGRTASKARYAAWLSLDMCGVSLIDISVRRAPWADMEFPPVPPVNAELNNREREVILNAYGGGAHIQPEQWGYRDHQCVSPTDPTLLKFVELGLFRGPYGVDEKGDTPGWAGAFFYLTDEGKHLARALIGAREGGQMEAA